MIANMRKYQFTMKCLARGEIRAADVIAFVNLMQEAFNRTEWVDTEGRPVELEKLAMERALRGDTPDQEIERFGVTWVAKSTGDSPSILLSVATGGQKFAPNWFTADFSLTQELPDLSYFRKAIELIRPFEAVILDLDNDESLRSMGVVVSRMAPPASRVTSLRWFHYLDRNLTDKVGGISCCLTTPAYRVEPFCDGVLIQLTDEPFNAQNPEHCLVQCRAMQFLGIGEWKKDGS